MSEDGHGGEGMLEGIEGAMTLFGEIPRSVLPGEPGQQDCDVGMLFLLILVSDTGHKCLLWFILTDKSRAREVEDDWPFTSPEGQSWSWYLTEPSNLHVQANMTALTREMWGGVQT